MTCLAMCYELLSVVEPVLLASTQQARNRWHSHRLILELSQSIIGAAAFVEEVAAHEQFARCVR